MNVLIGCEESGTVRDAFAARGHKVLSCDLMSSRRDGPHYKGDIFDVIDYPWDLAIFHPPCTHTSVSGARHFAEKWTDGRQAAAVAFFMALVRRSAHILRTCFEQPVSIMSSLYRKPDQVIQPHWFGHPEFKATCLWLKGLPKLHPTTPLQPPEKGSPQWSEWNAIHRMAPSSTRSRDRSKTYSGVALAMASQWSEQMEFYAETANDR